MTDKKKPTKKSNANTTGATKKAAARTRIEKAGKQKPGATKVSSQSRKLVASSRDITDRKSAEAALRESQKLLETIIETAPS